MGAALLTRGCVSGLTLVLATVLLPAAFPAALLDAELCDVLAAVDVVCDPALVPFDDWLCPLDDAFEPLEEADPPLDEDEGDVFVLPPP